MSSSRTWAPFQGRVILGEDGLLCLPISVGEGKRKLANTDGLIPLTNLPWNILQDFSSSSPQALKNPSVFCFSIVELSIFSSVAISIPRLFNCLQCIFSLMDLMPRYPCAAGKWEVHSWRYQTLSNAFMFLENHIAVVKIVYWLARPTLFSFLM